MPNKYQSKATIAFRIDDKLIKSFTSLTQNQFGHGGISKVLEILIKNYVEKYDGVKDGKRLPAPSLMAEFNSELKFFIKTLDIEITQNPQTKKNIFDGPLQYLINNLQDAFVYAKALRVMRVVNKLDYQRQLKTQLTIEEAYDMIIHSNMDQYLGEKLNGK